MRMKVWISVVAAVSFVLTGVALPVSSAGAAGALAPAASGEKLTTCASPPDHPEATTENRDRFVDLWSARMADRAWMKEFGNLEEVPDNILAEGFHAMNGQVQLWLNACLLDDMLETANETPGAQKFNQYLTGLNLMIFGKAGLQQMREELNETVRPDMETQPVKKDLTAEALDDMVEELSSEPSLTSADQPQADADAPKTSVSENHKGAASPELKTLVSEPEPELTSSEPVPLLPNPTVDPTGVELLDAILVPLLELVLEAVHELLQVVADIQQTLFTLPGVNLLATVFYRICAESPTMPLSCSVSLPVGVPIPADVTGDNFPDVTGTLFPMVNVLEGNVGARFTVQRMFPNAGPLTAHVFAVYETPLVKKRIQFGYDGRASTLAKNTATTFTLKHAVSAVTGDIEVAADVKSNNPGSTQALTFAVKSLVGGSIGVPASEEDPMAGSVQMSPFPTDFQVGAHLIHTSPRSQDIFTVASSTPTKVDAVIDQKTTTTEKKSDRRFTATVDKLPTSVKVDLVRDGDTQSIDYTASAPIDLVRATDTTRTDIVDHPNSHTKGVYEVKGVPKSVQVDLVGSEDITYKADAKIPEVSFSTETVEDSALKKQITATAHGVPQNIHVTNLTDEVAQKVTYDADDELTDVELGMFDWDEKGPGTEDDIKTNLVAKATGIPTEMEFQATNETGAYDFTSNTGIDLIEASLTQNDGQILPMPGTDHATIYKRGKELGVDFRLSGFTSAHFDGHEDTNVALGLTPGGQTFDAIADIDDSGEPEPGPNVLATAHIGALPSSMAVSFDPDNGTADYTASSVIPLLTASFTDRETEMFGNATLTDLPKNIGVTFNTTGETPEVTYDADSRLGSIDLNYSEKPGGLGIHGLIEDLPEYMRITGLDPIVFDARTSAGAPSGSSDIGKILFQFATDGVFASPPTTDDHAYLDTDLADSTHAELQYSGLRYLSVDTSDEELHATIKNTAARLFRAYLTTPSLTLTGFIDKVPAEITIAQVGNLVSYDASSSIAQIYTDLERTNGDTIAVDIQGVPQEIDLLFDAANSQLEWDASAATTSVSAIAHLTPDTIGGDRAFDASLSIGQIPTHWDATWAGGNVLFQAPAPGIGSIEARVTNHGAYHVLPGDHLSGFYDQTAGTAPGDLDASLKISNLTKASFSKITNASGGGFQADLNMGNNGVFRFAGDVTLPGTKLKATGHFDNLPSQINLKSDSGRITYTGNTNPDLTLSVKAGAPAAFAALPAVPTPHGVAVRDAAAAGGKAYAANVYLTGLPTGLDLNTPAGTYEVTGYHPSIATLSVDAILTTLAAQPLTLQLQQVVPTASPVNFKFGPFLTSTDGAGNSTLSLNYTSNQDLGSLTAEATYGNTDDAKLYISEIPKAIAVNASFGADTKTVGVTMDHGIEQITASYKKVGAANFAASVNLEDIPSAVSINIGKESSGSGGNQTDAPVFTMTASSPGLDIDAYATAEIADPVDANAAVSLTVDDLGQTVTADLIGTRLHITSAPATGGLAIQAAGRVQKDISLDWDGGIFQNEGNLDVDLKIQKVTLGLTGFSDVNLRLGFTTGLDGSYDSFTFGQESNLTIGLREKFSVYIDWPDPFGSDTITLVNVPQTTIPLGNVVPRWHINANKFGEIFDIPFFFFVIGECNVQFDARPAPGYTTPGSTFTLGAPPAAPAGETPAWLMTPDISLLGFSLPDFALDIIAFFLSPYGNGIQAHPVCETYL